LTLTRLALIKNQEILSIISEVSYVLALSNEPQQLVEMVLDRLLHLLEIDYIWAQLVGREDRKLQLVASCSNTPGMAETPGLTNSQQALGERVLIGLKVVIPDLSRNASDGLSSFDQAGFRSLVVVPIRTYHTRGVIGVASRTRRHFGDETAELLMTVAALVGAALNVAELGRMALDREKRRIAEEMSKRESVMVDDISKSTLPTVLELPVEPADPATDSRDVGIKDVKSREFNPGDDGAFEDHSRRMALFCETHGS
jgi:transcriptional regulator with GAF, ATPase, and Fis domain